MKRLMIFLTMVLVATTTGLFVNCSSPLKSADDNPSLPGPGGKLDTFLLTDTIFAIDTIFNGDTIFAIDTIFNGDTIYAIDTIFNGDTIFAIDTIITSDTIVLVDTVEIFPPDSLISPVVCARLSSGHQDIVWMFRNEEKLFNLEFVAALERDKPNSLLSVDINGELYEWNLAESLEMNLSMILEQNSVIRIKTCKPPSYGHAIDICLTISEP